MCTILVVSSRSLTVTKTIIIMTDRETLLAEIVGQMSLSKIYRRFDPILGLHQCK